ncbi:MAG: peptidoglycan DD-metalloendopeptidase family protein [Sphingomonas sp.]|nr:peptidoglycan DD-metalloendopeptidase family protein [Sphingomonas sp.]
MRGLVLAAAVPALIAASTPLRPAAPLLDDQLKAARAEQSTAEAEAERLEAIAATAKGKSERLAAEQAAAVQAIDAAEARITATETELRLASANLAAFRTQLALAERPVSALLAGLAMISERPPILALADRGGVDELVKTRILLAATMPVVQRRSAALAAQIARGQRIERAAVAARQLLLADRGSLVTRQHRLAALEQMALAANLDAGGAALTASDRVMAGRETLADLSGGGRASSALLAGELIAAGPAPARPSADRGARTSASFDYQLPVEAAVTRGLAEIDRGGVRSRGLVLAAARGAPLVVPADGILRFAGPFRDYDGVVIIDHGNGWISLIVNVATTIKAGASVRRGDSLGRALGPIEVELSHNGQRVSPAIIAGSSDPLSKGGKGG